MQVWVQWHGGSSYAPAQDKHLEEFESLSAASEEFRNRANGWGEFRYTDQPHDSVATPAVGTNATENGGPSMWVYLRDPRAEWDTPPGDAYPDRIIEFGPHGGLRITPA